MRHAREDYNERIQDSANLIPKHEPVFLLRAQDKHASKVLRYYASLVKSAEISDLTMSHADLMDSWPHKKEPDL